MRIIKMERLYIKMIKKKIKKNKSKVVRKNKKMIKTKLLKRKINKKSNLFNPWLILIHRLQLV